MAETESFGDKICGFCRKKRPNTARLEASTFPSSRDFSATFAERQHLQWSPGIGAVLHRFEDERDQRDLVVAVATERLCGYGVSRRRLCLGGGRMSGGGV